MISTTTHTWRGCWFIQKSVECERYGFQSCFCFLNDKTISDLKRRARRVVSKESCVSQAIERSSECRPLLEVSGTNYSTEQFLDVESKNFKTWYEFVRFISAAKCSPSRQTFGMFIQIFISNVVESDNWKLAIENHYMQMSSQEDSAGVNISKQ